MRTREIAGLAATLLIAVPVAGCGGDDSNRDAAYTAPPRTATTAAGADTAKAKGAARTAATAVESCFVDNQDYTKCKSAKVLSVAGVDVGTAPGQATVTKATASTYRIEAHADADTVFALERSANGTTKRTCEGPSCEAGTW